MLIVLLCALLLDYFFGEPVKYHPLAAFGRFADYLEERLNENLTQVDAAEKIELTSATVPESSEASELEPETRKAAQQIRLNGFLAVLICLVPVTWLTYSLIGDGVAGFILEVIILYFAIGLHSLKQHAQDILSALKNGQLEQARQALSMIVSRDAQQMDEPGICRASTESVLENGNDAVFATIFWFVVAGAPGVIVYRLSNTLDAMWGYKTARFNDFGFFAAKLDDILNYIPARLTALCYALTGNWKNAMHCWSTQGSLWESPNAGVVMAAGAGALDVQLGGADQYHGEDKDRADLGCGQKAEPETIQQACELLNRSTILWVIVIALLSLPDYI